MHHVRLHVSQIIVLRSWQGDGGREGEGEGEVVVVVVHVHETVDNIYRNWKYDGGVVLCRNTVQSL